MKIDHVTKPAPTPATSETLPRNGCPMAPPFMRPEYRRNRRQ